VLSARKTTWYFGVHAPAVVLHFMHWLRHGLLFHKNPICFLERKRGNVTCRGFAAFKFNFDPVPWLVLCQALSTANFTCACSMLPSRYTRWHLSENFLLHQVALFLISVTVKNCVLWFIDKPSFTKRKDLFWGVMKEQRQTRFPQICPHMCKKPWQRALSHSGNGSVHSAICH